MAAEETTPVGAKPAGVWNAEQTKLEAESRAADAQTTVNEATAEKTRAETRKLEAEAADAEARAVKAQIDAERETEKRSEERTADKFHHRYLLDSEVTETTVKKCVAQMATWERTASDSLMIDLVINSPGGSVVDGFALIDYIAGMHSRGHTVNTVAYGMAASMGGVILQIGKKRSMGANAVLLIHEASFGAVGSYGEVQDRVKLVDIFHDRILALFTGRSKVTKQFIKRNWTRKDWWLSAGDALKYGFVDDVR